jgi:general stress protein 26
MENNYLVYVIKLEEKHRLFLVAARELLKVNRSLLYQKYAVIDSVLDEEYRQAQLGIIIILHFMKKGNNYVKAKSLTEIVHHLSKVQEYCLSFSEENRRKLYAAVSVTCDYVYDILNDFFDIREDMP